MYIVIFYGKRYVYIVSGSKYLVKENTYEV